MNYSRIFLAVFLRTLYVLEKRLEISTPFTSITKLHECIFLWNKGLDVYNGDVCTHPPLIVLLFAQMPQWALPVLFISFDVVISALLFNIASFKTSLSDKETDQREEKEDETMPKPISLDPEWVAWSYLLNPYTIMACSGKSLGILCNVFVLAGVLMALNRNVKASMAFLSIASYIGLYPILLVPPTLFFFSNKKDLSKGLLVFLVFSTCLISLSTNQVGSWKWMLSTYGSQILASDLTPNIGLWWYFFIQVFNTFRTFFVCLFSFLLLIFVMPVTLKFRGDYLFTVYILCSILAIFKSYPSLSDISLMYGLLAMFPETFNYVTSSFLLANTVFYASLLGPLFFHLWIYASSGNANFFYAITLVWGFAQMSLLIEMITGYLRRQWDKENPELRKARVEVFLN